MNHLTKAQIPKGVQDLFAEDAACHRWLEAHLLKTFRTWGYEDVIPPTFEFFDNMAVGLGDQLTHAMFKLVDSEGSLLALRADITNGVARILATKLTHAPLPIRVCYAGSVFRQERALWGKQREFHQAGVELVGADDPRADAEVLALCLDTLGGIGLEGHRLNLGHIGFFKALIGRNEVADDAVTELRQAVDNRDQGRLEELLETLPLSPASRRALLALPTLCGGVDVLDRASRLCTDEEALKALDRLRKIHRLLAEFGLDQQVLIDLGEVKGIDYYTGIMFEGFVPGLGFPVLSGGRYDNLMSEYGRPLAAVGFAFTLERLQLCLRSQDSSPASIPPRVEMVVGRCTEQEGYRLAETLRRLGLIVINSWADPQTNSPDAILRGMGSGKFELKVTATGRVVEMNSDPGGVKQILKVLSESSSAGRLIEKKPQQWESLGQVPKGK